MSYATSAFLTATAGTFVLAAHGWRVGNGGWILVFAIACLLALLTLVQALRERAG